MIPAVNQNYPVAASRHDADELRKSAFNAAREQPVLSSPRIRLLRLNIELCSPFSADILCFNYTLFIMRTSTLAYASAGTIITGLLGKD